MTTKMCEVAQTKIRSEFVLKPTSLFFLKHAGSTWLEKLDLLTSGGSRICDQWVSNSDVLISGGFRVCPVGSKWKVQSG